MQSPLSCMGCLFIRSRAMAKGIPICGSANAQYFRKIVERKISSLTTCPQVYMIGEDSARVGQTFPRLLLSVPCICHGRNGFLSRALPKKINIETNWGRKGPCRRRVRPLTNLGVTILPMASYPGI